MLYPVDLFNELKSSSLNTSVSATMHKATPNRVIRDSRSGKVDLFSTILAHNNSGPLPVLEPTTTFEATGTQPHSDQKMLGLRHAQPADEMLDRPSSSKKARQKSPTESPSPPSVAQHNRTEVHHASTIPSSASQAATHPSASTSSSVKSDDDAHIQASPPRPGARGKWLKNEAIGRADDLEEFYRRRGVGPGQKGRPFHGKPTDALLAYCQYPEEIEEEFMYYYDDRVVVINDAYAKSQYHYLVLPRRRILYLSDLKGEEGINTVKELVGRALWLVDRLKANDPTYEYKYGFHVRQSMSQIHLHVLSTDYSTARMKRKEHWNSFTTEFFISPTKVLQILRVRGEFRLSEQERDRFDAIYKQYLHCPECKEVLRTMPQIKSHYQERHWYPRHLERKRALKQG